MSTPNTIWVIEVSGDEHGVCTSEGFFTDATLARRVAANLNELAAEFLEADAGEGLLPNLTYSVTKLRAH